MKQLIRLLGLLALIVIVAGTQAVVAAKSKRKSVAETRFKVRIENISNANGQTAADGTRWPFALSPGLYAVHEKDAPFFSVGKRVRGNGLEAQAEDGDPMMLAQSLKNERGILSSGVFNIPVGATAPGPVTPGAVYEFEFSATEGAKLSLALMFGQSNDLFYAPGKKGIRLFDSTGAPISGDVTSQLILWDAGTEVNQEPGVGRDQAPRQKAPNTGASEKGVVREVKDQFSYPKTTEVFRVHITPIQ